MSKQSEIREGIATVIRVNKDKFARCLESDMAGELTEELIYWMTDKIRQNLNSQGVVIKVDSEYFPTILCPNCEGLITSDVPKDAGYVAVEPLV